MCKISWTAYPVSSNGGVYRTVGCQTVIESTDLVLCVYVCVCVYLYVCVCESLSVYLYMCLCVMHVCVLFSSVPLHVWVYMPLATVELQQGCNSVPSLFVR